MNVTTNKIIYEQREKVSLSVNVVDLKGNPQQADISMSICDSGKVLVDKNDLNIVSFLNLSSELKGNIESPGYYFDSDNLDRHQALDVLMLTQGWRRFNWEDILVDRSPLVKWKPERGFSIHGQVLDKNKNRPIEDGKIIFFENGVSGDAIITRTEPDGSFGLYDLRAYDTSKMSIIAENRRGNKSIVKVKLDTLVPQLNCPFEAKALKKTFIEFETDFVNQGFRQKLINATYQFGCLYFNLP